MDRRASSQRSGAMSSAPECSSCDGMTKYPCLLSVHISEPARVLQRATACARHDVLRGGQRETPMSDETVKRCPCCGLHYQRVRPVEDRRLESADEIRGVQAALSASRVEVEDLRRSLEACQFAAGECAWATIRVLRDVCLGSGAALSPAEQDRLTRALQRVEWFEWCDALPESRRELRAVLAALKVSRSAHPESAADPGGMHAETESDWGRAFDLPEVLGRPVAPRGAGGAPGGAGVQHCAREESGTTNGSSSVAAFSPAGRIE